jgi:hypothetical protein
MDGVLARANCLLITTLWTASSSCWCRSGRGWRPSTTGGIRGGVRAHLGLVHRHRRDSEIGGALYGKQTLRVWGIGDINRKSVGGTVSGFAAALVFCLWIVIGRGLPAPWIGLAIVIAVSNTLLELFSPRGTDDVTMATTNAAICWAFGAFVL